jgi:hypothetical protein
MLYTVLEYAVCRLYPSLEESLEGLAEAKAVGLAAEVEEARADQAVEAGWAELAVAAVEVVEVE